MNHDLAESVFVIWSSADVEVAENLVFMYTLNAKLNQWWKTVRLVIWGPTARLAAENAMVQERLGELLESGVEIWACKACADQYGTSERLELLGVKVLYMGAPLTEMLKQGWKQLTF